MSEVISILSARSASTASSASTSASTHAGEAFRVVQRGGRVFHVSSTADDHKVFELPRRGAETGGTPAA